MDGYKHKGRQVKLTLVPAVLDEPALIDRSVTVGDMLAGRLGTLLYEMVVYGDITQGQADRLLKVETE